MATIGGLRTNATVVLRWWGGMGGLRVTMIVIDVVTGRWSLWRIVMGVGAALGGRLASVMRVVWIREAVGCDSWSTLMMRMGVRTRVIHGVRHRTEVAAWWSAILSNRGRLRSSASSHAVHLLVSRMGSACRSSCRGMWMLLVHMGIVSVDVTVREVPFVPARLLSDGRCRLGRNAIRHRRRTNRSATARSYPPRCLVILHVVWRCSAGHTWWRTTVHVRVLRVLRRRRVVRLRVRRRVIEGGVLRAMRWRVAAATAADAWRRWADRSRRSLRGGHCRRGRRRHAAARTRSAATVVALPTS